MRIERGEAKQLSRSHRGLVDVGMVTYGNDVRWHTADKKIFFCCFFIPFVTLFRGKSLKFGQQVHSVHPYLQRRLGLNWLNS